MCTRRIFYKRQGDEEKLSFRRRAAVARRRCAGPPELLPSCSSIFEKTALVQRGDAAAQRFYVFPELLVVAPPLFVDF